LICAVVAQKLQPLFLLVLSGALVVLLIWLRVVIFLKLLRRTRWILVSLLLIYALATPGIYLFPELGSASPTLEGLQGGALQIWRLTVLLAALALLLRVTDRESLLSGLYTIMKPFKPLGVNAERIAVRLWLTLRYAEMSRGGVASGSWTERVLDALEPGSEITETLRLEVRPFIWVDWLVLMLALGLGMRVMA
jgi:energy-coupling factor transporter transmembrane protein EcfT